MFIKKRILVVTDSYPPELRSASELMRDLAEGLAERGHEVYAVTSYPKFNLAEGSPKDYPLVSSENGVNVLRVKGLPHHKVNFVVRGIAQLLLPHLFYRVVRKNISGKLDYVILHSPPLPLSSVSAKIAKKYSGKYILNLHDFFPQNAVDLGILKNKPIIKFFQKMEARAYKDADLIIVPSGGHKNFLEKKRDISGSKVRVVPHWVDPEPFIRARPTGKFRKLYGLEGKFVFIFAGVLGPSQGLDLIIDIADKLKDNKEIVFLFTGDGMEKNKLMEAARRCGLSNVIFKPFGPAEDYPWLLKDMNVGIISLTSKNTTPAVPAKITGYMAASLPVIGFLHKESDGHLMIREANCGLSSLYSDKKAALEIVLKMYREKDKLSSYGENGFKYVMNSLDKSICIGKFENYLNETDE